MEKCGYMDLGRLHLPRYGAYDRCNYDSIIFHSRLCAWDNSRNAGIHKVLWWHVAGLCGIYAGAQPAVPFHGPDLPYDILQEMYLMPCLWLSVDFMLYRQKEKLTAVPGEGRFSDEKRSFF